MKYTVTHPEKSLQLIFFLCFWFDETWSIDLMHMSGDKNSHNNFFGFILGIIDSFSIYTWCRPLKNKYGRTITDKFSNFLTWSRRSRINIESDWGAEFYKKTFDNPLRLKNTHQSSRFVVKGRSFADPVYRKIHDFLEKPVF